MRGRIRNAPNEVVGEKSRKQIKKSNDPQQTLNEKFVRAVFEEFDRHGAEALEEVRKKRPWDFLRCVGAVQSKMGATALENENLTYAQVEADLIAELRQLAACGVDLHALVASAIAGMETESPA